ncbi:histidine phosphatase family protein [Acetobacter conturbans]|uniref:Phosphoglycerate mutase n=1 Tax=Acetobacter conturbans TaxID=1737472 RepID=A0ABX0JV46_9PROT|nr:phosphoglycerate mutase [Acetobacter conturbans]
MRVVCLARHPAVAVASGLCYGLSDVPLAVGWEAFAARLATRMRDHEIRLIVTSPLMRCRVPAERAIALAGGSLRLDDRLREISFGAWEGCKWSDISHAALDEWAADLTGFVPPGGESGEKLIERVQAFWMECPTDEPFVILSHGGPLRVLSALAKGEAVDLSVKPIRQGEVDVIDLA